MGCCCGGDGARRREAVPALYPIRSSWSRARTRLAAYACGVTIEPACTTSTAPQDLTSLIQSLCLGQHSGAFRFACTCTGRSEKMRGLFTTLGPAPARRHEMVPRKGLP